ncbi:hypothetical protein [Methylocella sp.]|uniref:hypothetical protein n=1 Tax=Methylocella sp. TaxID=1978226 RepID=UPI0037831B98
MHISRGAAAACGVLISFAALSPSWAGETPKEADRPAASDWPCKQILVETVSPAAVWSGPPIDGVEWSKDETVAQLVARISARRTPVETAEKEIDAFAAAAGAQKTEKLVAVFAGAFETLNAERAQIIDGLKRFDRKQKALAKTIRAENAAIQKKASAEPGMRTDVEPANDPETQKLQLDLRLFEEGRKSLTFACEAPTLVEQRIFAVARAVQAAMD